MKKTIIKILISILFVLFIINISSIDSYCADNSAMNYVQADPYNSQMAQMRNSFSPQTIIYFSTSGSDQNDGLSPTTPKLDPSPYITSGNCQCLLKSGDVFSIRSTINVGSNVVISTYGGKSRAGLSFIQTTIDTFKPADPQNGIFVVALNPNDSDTGWISVDGSINWKRILSPSLSNNNEYYVDRAANAIYIKSASDLTGKHARYAYGQNGLYIIHGQNVIVENIEISGAGYHGISIISESNVLISNCFIHDIGGGIHQSSGAKYGNGIQIWASVCDNIAIYKSIVTDCFDAGITPQCDTNQRGNSSNLFFLNNLVERCNYGFEAFHSSTSYTMQNVVASNNIFYDIKDITGGYRLTQSSTDYTALLCLWAYSNSNSSILIDHNFGFKSQASAISYAWRSDVRPPIIFTNNTLITSNEPIKYPNQYTGDDSQYLISVPGSIQYKNYETLAKKLISKYSQKKLIK